MFFPVKLKKLGDQVLVITGATSGIGMATAKMAASLGAKVVLTARDARALRKVTAEIRRKGGEADWISADVADFEAVKKVRDFALGRFGRFDTWINNAGIHIFGKVEQTPEEDARRLFDVNYWGVVYGSRAAVPFLRENGGSLINIGSVLSSRSIPLQGFYGASKHAVQGYTEALRLELEREGAPVAVTLVKPSSIDTPIPMHSKNVMEKRSRLPFPMYDPEVAARGILYCAENPRRDIVIGGAGKVALLGEKFTPLLTDFGMKQLLFRMQKAEGAHREEDTLHSTPRHPPRERGEHDYFVGKRSVYTWAERHRLTAAAMSLAALAGASALLRRKG